MSNIKSEVVSSFTRNGKMYLVLEIDTKDTLQGTTSFPIPWPDWGDFDFDVTFRGGELCLTVLYKGNKKWEQCVQILDECYQPGDIDLFSIGEAKIYMRYISCCPIENGVNVRFAIWARAGKFKIELGTFNRDITA
ncbi:hypothetical protein [Bacillus sp. FSL W7-1085]|uniref:hypothetical protein n=1 Tax=Bacillus sp. FSL W7-1085 TaxID=2921694 RepID=UPI00315B3DD9